MLKFAPCLVFALTLASLACSSSTDANPEMLTACNAVCDHQTANATDCAANWDNSFCSQICTSIASTTMTDECAQAHIASWECQKTLTYSCMDGGELPVATDADDCATEMDAVTACQTTSGS